MIRSVKYYSCCSGAEHWPRGMLFLKTRWCGHRIDSRVCIRPPPSWPEEMRSFIFTVNLSSFHALGNLQFFWKIASDFLRVSNFFFNLKWFQSADPSFLSWNFSKVSSRISRRIVRFLNQKNLKRYLKLFTKVFADISHQRVGEWVNTVVRGNNK